MKRSDTLAYLLAGFAVITIGYGAWRMVSQTGPPAAETAKAAKAAEVAAFAAEVAAAKAADEHDAFLKRSGATDAERKTAETAKAAQAAEVAAEGDRRAAATCRADLRCWGDKHHFEATFKCRTPIEKLAKYSFEWTDGWLESKFWRFKWGSKPDGTVVYIGDRIKFQNGFGAWQYYTYFCTYDPTRDAALEVNALPGRLPDTP